MMTKNNIVRYSLQFGMLEILRQKGKITEKQYDVIFQKLRSDYCISSIDKHFFEDNGIEKYYIKALG